MNPLNFPVFEEELVDIADVTKTKDYLLQHTSSHETAVQLDLIGKRVSIYNSLIDVPNTIKHTILPLLSGHIAKSNKYKRWNIQLDEHYSLFQKEVMRLFHSQKPTLCEITKF